MEFDLNSGLNLNFTPKIQRSRSSAPKSQDESFKIDKRLDFNNDFKNILNNPSKSNQESKIQVHIRVKKILNLKSSFNYFRRGL